MARTLYGNLTGAAARTDLADRRRALLDDAPNGYDWQRRLVLALNEMDDYEHLVAIWESGIVPAKATYRKHAQLAELLLQYKDVVPAFEPLPVRS